MRCRRRTSSRCSTRNKALSKRRGIPNGAEFQTAPNSKRRRIPNGAEFQTARNSKRRGIPTETAPEFKQRRVPNGAESPNSDEQAPNSKRRGCQDGMRNANAARFSARPVGIRAGRDSESRRSRTARRLEFSAVWNSAPSGIQRRLEFSAVWKSSAVRQRRLEFSAVRNSAPYGIQRRLDFSAVRMTYPWRAACGQTRPPVRSARRRAQLPCDSSRCMLAARSGRRSRRSMGRRDRPTAAPSSALR